MSLDDTQALKPFIAKLARGEALSSDDSQTAFGIVMDGKATPAQIGGMLMAMRVRGETIDELTGAVIALRARMLQVEAPPGAIDVCGTGGDGSASLNISTAVAFVVAACGVSVAKHGNRALSSRAGAADALKALGVNIDVPTAQLAAILHETGCVFLFAPHHHPALRYAGPVRAELGTRTIFNLIGPMANPAGVKLQLSGVFDPSFARPMAQTLANLGTERAWIYHGGGLDELVLHAPNLVVALEAGNIREFNLSAADAGLQPVPREALNGGDAAYNAAAITALLAGAPSGYRETVLFNAAGALIVAGKTTSLKEGVAMSQAALDSGQARAVLDALKSATQPKAA